MQGVQSDKRGLARRRRGQGRPFLAVAAMALVAACSTARNEAPPAEGSAPAESSAYVTLERAAHPLARPESDVGRLDADRVIHNLSLVFKPTPAQRSARDALLAEIQRPGSPSYHRWHTPQDYAARFGADPATLAAATAWLASQGLTVHDPSPLGTRATFTGTVSQIEAAFRTELHAYDVGGERHYAMARPPSVPAAFADRVLGLVNAHDFNPRRQRPQIRVVDPDATCPGGDTHCNGNGLAPPDWTFIYDVGPLYNPGIDGTKITGAGVTVMIVGITDISQQDLTAFRTRYGLGANNITKTVVPNTGGAVAGNGAGLEAVLDTEWAGAIAPSATINYVYTGGSDANVDDAVFYAVEQNYGGVLSESWGGCEDGAAPADADVEEVYGAAAALEGISYLAASGDDGAAACGGKGGLWVNLPASIPQVTAVGGTGFARPAGLTFSAAGTVDAVGTEAVWNEADNAYTGSVLAGGGGISSVFARPLYQSGIATCTPVGSLPTSVNAATQRQVPDVAFSAAAGGAQYGIFIECTLAGNDCTNTGTNPVIVEIGGTSASTPSFAGVVALANQATGGRLGNINPLLYATHGSVPTAFHDVTTGNNEVVCRTADTGCPGNNQLYGYAATNGYDCASGLGSVDATKLVTAWAALTPTATAIGASPTATTEGGTVTLTATVDVNGSNTHALGGDVSFVFRSYLQNQVLDLSWSLGDVVIANGTPTSGTVTLTTSIPSGMVQPNQAVDVFAMYGGDAEHLPSYSPAQHITFSSPVTLCIAPQTTSVAKGATVDYTATGGVSPVRWYLDWDSTCNNAGTGCSNINVTTGVLTAGTGADGYVIVVAVDADGSETFSEVTVGGGTGTVPWSASGPSNYAGIVLTKTPIAACPSGDNCGTLPNGCGGTVTCGTCTAPLTCGGSGSANVCGCTPITACPGGQNCGTASNGCGGTLSCGTCTAPQTCGGSGTANVCGCTPITACPSGFNCGAVPNGCGGGLMCGACTAPQTCGGSGTANMCGCTPIAACPAGDNCGTVSNGCGGTLSCGTCGAAQTCMGNTCVASSSSSSSSTSTSSTSTSSGSTSSGSTSSGSTSSGSTGSSSGGSSDAGTGGAGGSGTTSSSGGTGGSGGGSGTSSSGGLATGGSETGGAAAGGSGTGNQGTNGAPGKNGGCGCKVAGDPEPATPPGLAAFGALALAGVIRSRRRRASARVPPSDRAAR